MSEPLWKLTRKDCKWVWSDEQQQTFEKLKQSISTRCMAFFNVKWETEVIVDASHTGIGAVLCQYNPINREDRRIVCFASRMLTDVERRYSQCEKEALAAVWGPERFWIYLMGKQFKLITDNRAIQLIFANTAAKPPARIERLALRLSQFDYTVEHKPGISNIADYYSRHPLKAKASAFLEELKTEQYINFIVKTVLPVAVTVKEVTQATEQDEEMQKLIKALSTGITPDKLPKELTKYKQVYHELNVTKGIILRAQRILIPLCLRRRIVELAHVGHQGIVKTKRLIRSRVWYPGIDSQVEDLIRNCMACQTNVDAVKYEPMKITEMPAGPWQSVSGDFYGPMSNNRYLFVNHCDYSRYVLVDELKSVAFCHVKPILERHFSIFGTPHVYKTDNGSPFQSYDFEDFAKQWGFKHQKITPYWPRANPEVESFMKKINKVLRIVKLHGKDESIALQSFLRVYRATPHCTTKIAPAILMLGYSRTSGIPAIEDTFKNAHEIAKENDKLAKLKMKEEYDKRMKVKKPTIKEGSRVMVKWDRKNKTKAFWDPLPYMVTKVKGSMITAERESPRHTVTRNSSRFKEVKQGDGLKGNRKKNKSIKGDGNDRWIVSNGNKEDGGRKEDEKSIEEDGSKGDDGQKEDDGSKEEDKSKKDDGRNEDDGRREDDGSKEDYERKEDDGRKEDDRSKENYERKEDGGSKESNGSKEDDRRKESKESKDKKNNETKEVKSKKDGENKVEAKNSTFGNKTQNSKNMKEKNPVGRPTKERQEQLNKERRTNEEQKAPVRRSSRIKEKMSEGRGKM